MNLWIGMGRLTAEPNSTFTPNGVCVCKFTIAVDREFQKQGEERKADFINCVAWNKTGEFINTYFKKSSMIAVRGRIEPSSWDDAEGKKHYKTEVNVDKAYFTGEKKQGNTEVKPQSTDGFYPLEDDEDVPF